MLVMEESLVKVAIPLAGPDAWDRETVWAAPLGDDLYEIRDVAWLAEGVHNKVVVRCRRGPEGGLQVVEVVTPSGHNTLHLIVTPEATDGVRETTLAALERR